MASSLICTCWSMSGGRCWSPSSPCSRSGAGCRRPRAGPRLPGNADRSALWLCAGGEFGFVLLYESAPLPRHPQVALTALVLSTPLSPFVVHYSERLVMCFVASERRRARRADADRRRVDVHRKARVPRSAAAASNLARFLGQEGVNYIALNLHPDRVRAGGRAAARTSALWRCRRSKSRRPARCAGPASSSTTTADRHPRLRKTGTMSNEARPELAWSSAPSTSGDMARLNKAGAARSCPRRAASPCSPRTRWSCSACPAPRAQAICQTRAQRYSRPRHPRHQPRRTRRRRTSTSRRACTLSALAWRRRDRAHARPTLSRGIHLRGQRDPPARHPRRRAAALDPARGRRRRRRPRRTGSHRRRRAAAVKASGRRGRRFPVPPNARQSASQADSVRQTVHRVWPASARLAEVRAVGEAAPSAPIVPPRKPARCRCWRATVVESRVERAGGLAVQVGSADDRAGELGHIFTINLVFRHCLGPIHAAGGVARLSTRRGSPARKPDW